MTPASTIIGGHKLTYEPLKDKLGRMYYRVIIKFDSGHLRMGIRHKRMDAKALYYEFKELLELVGKKI